MNPSFNNQPSQGPIPPAPSSPFEMPGQQPAAPPPGAQPPAGQNMSPQQGMPPQPGMTPGGFQPTGMEPVKGKSSIILIIVLIIILVLGGLVFASWEGWINLGGIQNLWKKSSTTTTTPTTTTATTTTTTTNANDTLRKTDLANIKASLAKYFLANQTYPIAATISKTSDPNSILVALVPTYITTLPVDPLSPTNYYGYQSDGKTFSLTAVLEDKTDPSCITQGVYCIYKVTDVSVETPTTSTSTSSSSSTTSTPTTTTTQ